MLHNTVFLLLIIVPVSSATIMVERRNMMVLCQGGDSIVPADNLLGMIAQEGHNTTSFTYGKVSSAVRTLESITLPGVTIMVTDTVYTPLARITDHLGNVRALVDMKTGNVVERSDYYTYGTRIIQPSDTLTSYPTYTANRWRLASKEEQDNVSGLPYVDFGARQYDPFTASWLAPDPLAGDYPGISPYVYCAGDPVNLVDRDGKKLFLLGSNSAISDYLKMLSDVTGSVYNVDNNGFLYLNNNNSSRQRTESKTLNTIINTIISEESVYSVSLVGDKKDDDNVFIDSYENRSVDISDLKKIKKTSIALLGALIGHFLNEIHYNGTFQEAHRNSLEIEGKIYGELVGNQTIITRTEYPTAIINNGYQEVVFQYSDEYSFVFLQGLTTSTQQSFHLGFPVTVINCVPNGKLKSVYRR